MDADADKSVERLEHTEAKRRPLRYVLVIRNLPGDASLVGSVEGILRWAH